MVDRPSARARLSEATATRASTKAADDAARAELNDAIVEAHRAGLRQNEIVEISGLHRNYISRIIGDTPRD